MKNNENKSICATCKNRCCNQISGGFLPEQLTNEQIKSMLKNGTAIWHFSEYYDGNIWKHGYYLRPTMQGEIDMMFKEDKTTTDYARGNGKGCSFQTPTGCGFKFEDRPAECQALIPQDDKLCRSSWDEDSRKILCNAWENHELNPERKKLEEFLKVGRRKLEQRKLEEEC